MQSLCFLCIIKIIVLNAYTKAKKTLVSLPAVRNQVNFVAGSLIQNNIDGDTQLCLIVEGVTFQFFENLDPHFISFI